MIGKRLKYLGAGIYQKIVEELVVTPLWLWPPVPFTTNSLAVLNHCTARKAKIQIDRAYAQHRLKRIKRGTYVLNL